MLKFWRHLVAVPKGLDLVSKLYVWSLYLCSAIVFLLLGGFYLYVALVSDMPLLHRFVCIGIAILCPVIWYGLRLALYWIYSKSLLFNRFIERSGKR
jgi:hypothetical protein